jgi:hypothetical protein
MTGLMIRVMMAFSQRWGVFAGSGACDAQAQGSFIVQQWSRYHHRGIVRWCYDPVFFSIAGSA